jgi:hypothetical protein
VSFVAESNMVLSERQNRRAQPLPVGRLLKRGCVICVGMAFCAIGAGSFPSIAFAESNPVNNQGAPTASSRPSASLRAQPQGHVPQGETGPLDTSSGGAPAASPQGETPPGMQATPSKPKDSAPSKDDAVPRDPERR